MTLPHQSHPHRRVLDSNVITAASGRLDTLFRAVVWDLKARISAAPCCKHNSKRLVADFSSTASSDADLPLPEERSNGQRRFSRDLEAVLLQQPLTASSWGLFTVAVGSLHSVDTPSLSLPTLEPLALATAPFSAVTIHL